MTPLLLADFSPTAGAAASAAPLSMSNLESPLPRRRGASVGGGGACLDAGGGVAALSRRCSRGSGDGGGGGARALRDALRALEKAEAALKDVAASKAAVAAALQLQQGGGGGGGSDGKLAPQVQVSPVRPCSPSP